jgi:hypothetical protein
MFRGFFCLHLISCVKIVPLLVAHRPQVLFAKILMYLVNILLQLIIFESNFFVLVAFCVLFFFCLAQL